MKKFVLVLGVAGGLLVLMCSGCVERAGYGGAYGAVYGEYPSTYSGTYYVDPGYSYSYPGYAYGYPAYRYHERWAPYDRDHYWDRSHRWDGRGYRAPVREEHHHRDSDDRHDRD